MATELAKPLKSKRTQHFLFGLAGGGATALLWDNLNLYGNNKELFTLGGQILYADEAILLAFAFVLNFMGYKNIAIGFGLAVVIKKVLEIYSASQ